MATKYDASSRYRLDSTGRIATRRLNTSSVYTLYRVVAGDTLETIASRHFGTPKRYWEIADANPQVQFPLDIVVGEVLRLPR